MRRLLQQWGKDQVFNVGPRANLYGAIKRLHAAGAVAVRSTERAQQYPERTVYEITAEGRRILTAWLAEMISKPRNEFPPFPAALSFLMLLPPSEAASHLAARAEALEQALSAIDAALADIPASLPRVTLLEAEYQQAVTAAELNWVRSVVADLRARSLSWSEEDFAETAAQTYRDG
jgi:DNA-binding PadR family transcriptional regulator